jgi:hypothetical protein
MKHCGSELVHGGLVERYQLCAAAADQGAQQSLGVQALHANGHGRGQQGSAGLLLCYIAHDGIDPEILA